MNTRAIQQKRTTLYLATLTALQEMLDHCPYQKVRVYLLCHELLQENFSLSYKDNPLHLDDHYKSLLSFVDEAIQHFDRIAWVYVFRARLLCGIEYYKAAYEDIEKAKKLFSSYLPALTLQAEIDYMTGNYIHCAATTKQCLQHTIMIPRIFFLYALSLSKVLEHTRSLKAKLKYTQIIIDTLILLQHYHPYYMHDTLPLLLSHFYYLKGETLDKQ